MARKARPVPLEAAAEILRGFSADAASREAVVAKYTAAPWNWSRSRVYEQARKQGWTSGRKSRADRGQIRAAGVRESDIELTARVLLATTRHKTGKRLMASADLLQQMALNGHTALGQVSPSTLNRWLRDRHYDHGQLMADNPATQMRSLHPNHVHFVDASVCVQWDLNGRKKLVARDMQKAFYKNKPGYWRQVKQVLIRWLVVDHCSGAFYVDYTYASGENTVDLLNVLLDAWGRKPFADKYPFHGAPKILAMDPGAANTSHEVLSLCEKLDIERYVHAPGNSRASGSVETVHAYWERTFERELLLKRADDLDDLRRRAHDRMIYINAEAVHGRHGKSRIDKWMEIRQEQLRLLPPKDYCEKLATCKPETRVPDNRLRISFDGLEYQLAAPAIKSLPVNVDRNPWQVGDLNVWTVDGEEVPCRLITKDQHGFDERAPVFGEGRYQRHADTPAQQLKRHMEAEPVDERLRGFEPKPTAHLVPDQHFLPKRGTEIRQTELPKAPPIKAAEVAGKVRKALDLPRITPPMRALLDSWMGGRELLCAEEFEELLGRARAKWSKTSTPASSDAVRLVV